MYDTALLDLLKNPHIHHNTPLCILYTVYPKITTYTKSRIVGENIIGTQNAENL